MNQELRAKKNIVVLYHGNCRDGFSGAWAAWKKFKNRAEYVPLFYGADRQVKLPKGLANKEVYLIDFSLKAPGVMEKIVKNAKKVVALDHHADAQDFTKLAHESIFDNDRSGATITWSYFHPQKPVPKLLKYVEDVDIWKLKMPATFAVSANLALFESNFKIWDTLARILENAKSRSKFIRDGNLLLQYEEKRIQDLIEQNAELVEFCGIKTYAVNSPYWISQIGNLLSKKLPPMGIVWRRIGTEILISLRSERNFDVSRLAARFGGGGHKEAAAFSWPLNKKLPWRTP